MKAKGHRRQTIWMMAASMFVLTVTSTSVQAQSQWTGPDGSNNIYYNSGNVGIGTTNPGGVFEVWKQTSLALYVTRDSSGGSGKNQTLALGIDGSNGRAYLDSTHYSSGGYPLDFRVRSVTAMTVDVGGNVGIGTTSPGLRLDLAATSSGLPATSGSTQTGVFRLRGSSNSVMDFGSDGSSPFGNWIQSTDLTDLSLKYPLLLNPRGGNVGIGTTSPSAKLHVSNNFEGLRLSATNDTTPTWMQFNTSSFSGLGYFGVEGNTAGTLLPGTLAYATAISSGASGTALQLGSAGSVKMTILSGGNVGIGTTSPTETIDVRGNIKTSGSGITGIGFGDAGYALGSGGLYTVRANAALSGAGNLLHLGGYDGITFHTNDTPGSPSAAKMILDTSGNVGIGTPSPGAKLDVNGSIYSAGQIRANALSLLVWGTDASGANRVLSGAPNIESQDTGGLELGTSGSAPLVFYTGATERMRIDSSGNTNVTGNLNLTGTINAKYQDVAEWVESSEQLSAGTVVVLDSSKSNQVISSSQSYDTRVAGVISAQPGITLGEKGDNKVLVATTGRVKIKVDASKAPIHIGDLLVTSDVPGVAMKSEAVNLGGVQFHRPGTLIGKALEPLAKGMGEILVLLSLQ